MEWSTVQCWVCKGWGRHTDNTVLAAGCIDDMARWPADHG